MDLVICKGVMLKSDTSNYNKFVLDISYLPESDRFGIVSFILICMFKYHYLAFATSMWTSQWENVPSDMCANKDSNQPAHLRSLIRVFIVRMKKFCIFYYSKCAQWWFWSDCANAFADLNLGWAQRSEGTVLYVKTLIVVAQNVAKERIQALAD